MVWLTVLLLAGEVALWVAALSGPHICTRLETTMVTLRVHKKVPVTVKATTWCFKMPPRCTKYKEELRDSYTLQTEPRTRWVTECCPGYFPDAGNTTCYPECPLGCVHGLCQEYQKCSCNPGFMGSICDTPCEHGFWGKSCLQDCSCINHDSCDAATGQCRCSAGWRGDRCELPCEEGRFGEACLQRCSCEDDSTCHHVTGDCDAAKIPCSESTGCRPQWNGTQPEMDRLMLQPNTEDFIYLNANVSETMAPRQPSPRDVPMSEPLVTTNNYVEQDLKEESDSRETPVSSPQSYPSGTWNSTFENNATDMFTIVDPDFTTEAVTMKKIDNDSAEMIIDSASNSSTGRPRHEDVKQSATDLVSLLGMDHGRRLFEGESHEDQLEHATHEATTPPATAKGATDEGKLQQEEDQYGDDSTSESSESTDATDEDPLVQLPAQETTESSTPILQPITGNEDHASNEEKKKMPDQKKFKTVPDKERVKDMPVIKPVKKDQEWTKPVPEESADKDGAYHGSYREHVENGVDQDKPRKTSKQEQAFKEPSDVGLLKVAPNQERHSSGSKNSYSDFLSSFSIAAGVSMAIITVAGFITLLARYRRAKPTPPQQVAGVEMTAVGVRSLAPHEEAGKRPVSTDDATLPAIRPLFFSPVYLPGDGSPTDGNGGLILTAVFSTPATNIHDIYRQQDLLRETLASHYDVPPPSRRPHRDSQLSHGSHLSQVEDVEHVYEELPCQRGRSASPVDESNC